MCNEMIKPCLYVPGELYLVDEFNKETNKSRYGQKTFEELKEVYPTLVCVEHSEAFELIAKAVQDKYVLPKGDVIDKDRWYEMLEILPPCRWGSFNGVEFFHVSERLIYNVVGWYTKDSLGNCVTFNDDAKLERALIAERHRDALLPSN